MKTGTKFINLFPNTAPVREALEDSSISKVFGCETVQFEEDGQIHTKFLVDIIEYKDRAASCSEAAHDLNIYLNGHCPTAKGHWAAVGTGSDVIKVIVSKHKYRMKQMPWTWEGFPVECMWGGPIRLC